jgi:hypothetical protein
MENAIFGESCDKKAEKCAHVRSKYTALFSRFFIATFPQI